MPSRYSSDWMWARACEMIERAERLQQQFFQVGAETDLGPIWHPPVDVFETAREIWIIAALPGVPPACIELRIEAATLVLAGERRLPDVFRHAAVHRLEIPHGRFERRVMLPAGHYEVATHEMVDGCLVVSLRKLF
ncbi:MAG TPA: Hsp20/alpha crystallin family protein [Nitrococcus sp.]|nr:Hsp20/alpha crystallin family protein [Nitrococcus sp.]